MATPASKIITQGWSPRRVSPTVGNDNSDADDQMKRFVMAATLMAFASVSLTAQGTKKDTVDVPVGSTVVDFGRHSPGVTRAVQSRIMDGQTSMVPPILWKFTFVDSGAPLLLVHSDPEQAGAPSRGPSVTYVFDRKTVALRAIRNDADGNPMLTFDGTHIVGQMMGPGGPTPLDITLSSAAFFKPLADLVVESLPAKQGVVYRVPLWSPPGVTIETHLYEAVRREDVTVLGKTYKQANVIEDRSADGKTLYGTLWVVDGEPHLVRWVINMPNGATINLDQEVAPKR